MVQPDLLLICENMLMSEGFNQAKVLAKKMTVLYKLASEQLSKQYHYDFQLRALKSVLVMAGSLKRAFADLPEDIVLMRALRDMNMPKFVYDDVPLFQGLIADLFPGLQASRVGNEDLKEKISEVLEKRGFKHDQETAFSQQIDKVVQLYETMLTRHTTMVVGPTGAGKSVILQTLAQARKEDEEVNVRIDTMNPKMITTDELYGVLDSETRNWTDGLLSKIFKEANTPRDADSKPETRWILYDGDVDAVWVENMNSVMDDNRILTLANGDRIRL
jgi:dynein heavy chain